MISFTANLHFLGLVSWVNIEDVCIFIGLVYFKLEYNIKKS